MIQQFKKVLNRAEEQCKENGTRLTPKRRQILSELIKSNKALSAYELADLFKKEFKETIPTMSVYRILDFLERENLVHKLNLANKYIACAHITCRHSHDIPQFLICRSCNKVREISIDKITIGRIQKKVEKAEFELVNPQLEMHCVCKVCE
ncbi:MAG: transcriptional repressor, partial [Betaproteobacteria bacterium TMED156]